MHKTRTISVFRLFLVSLSLAITIWVLTSVYKTVTTTPDQVKTVEYDETVAQVFDSTRHDVDQFFEMTVLVLGGLWTLAVIDQDQHMRLGDIPELIMFIAGVGLLLTCLYFLHRYETVMTDAVWAARQLPADHRLFPDIVNSPYLKLHSIVVARRFYSGLAVSALTALSLCRLRINPAT